MIEPARGVGVGHDVDDRLVLHRVEMRDVPAQGVGREDGGRGSERGHRRHDQSTEKQFPAAVATNDFGERSHVGGPAAT